MGDMFRTLDKRMDEQNKDAIITQIDKMLGEIDSILELAVSDDQRSRLTSCRKPLAQARAVFCEEGDK